MSGHRANRGPLAVTVWRLPSVGAPLIRRPYQMDVSSVSRGEFSYLP